MVLIETWWEEIFSGALSIGLNKKNVHQLSDESFLYYSSEHANYYLSENQAEQPKT